MPEDPTWKGSKEAAPAPPDRVAMLSIRKDGSLDQHDPEFLNEEFGKEATARQLTERAVSAIDETKRPELGLSLGGAPDEETKLDPPIAELKDAHDQAAEQAKSAAESLVKSVGVYEPKAAAKPTPPVEDAQPQVPQTGEKHAARR